MIRQSLRGDSQLSMLKSAAASAEAATNPGSDLWTKALYLCSFDLGKAEADKVDKGDKETNAAVLVPGVQSRVYIIIYIYT